MNVSSFRPYKRPAQCYVSLHLKLHEYLWCFDEGTVWHREDYITQTTNILRMHVAVLSLHIISCVPNVIISAL